MTRGYQAVGLILALLLCGLAMNACAPYSPPPQPPTRPTPISCGSDPCRCEIKTFPAPQLETILRSPGNTPHQRRETAANIYDTAHFHKERYWSRKNRADALRAIRYWDGYLTLVSFDDSMAPYALLHSIALYCDQGCRRKADELASELRYYRYNPDDLKKSLKYCGG